MTKGTIIMCTNYEGGNQLQCVQSFGIPVYVYVYIIKGLYTYIVIDFPLNNLYTYIYIHVFRKNAHCVLFCN